MSAAGETDGVDGHPVRPGGGSPAEPLFRVVRGTPTDVEIAALSVVLVARTRPSEEAVPPRQGPTAWAASARAWPSMGRPGPDAWRMSARA